MNLLFHRFACVALLFAALSTQAAFDAYLKIEGVDGEAGDKSDKHKDWIEILSFSSGLLPGSPVSPAAASFQFTKTADKSSPILFERCAAGTSAAWARLELVQTNPTVARRFEVRMSNVLVTAASVTGQASASEDRPTESLSLNFTKIEWTYTIHRPRSRLPLEDRSATLDAAVGTSGSSTNAAVFSVTGIRQNSGAVLLSWQAVAGRTYDIYACPAVDGPYSLQTRLTATANGLMTHLAPVVPGAMFFAVEDRP